MNKVGPVKNQGGCGSCWAFAAATQQESADQIKHGKSYVRHSEQEYVDCSGQNCSGGWMTTAWNWSKNNGVSAESDYKYLAANGSCHHTDYNKVSYANSWGYLGSAAEAETYLQTQGPFSVALNAGNSTWWYYTGGVISGNCPTTGVDHAVVVVGAGYTTR